MLNDQIYLDYASTTPVDPKVADAMLPWLKKRHGNVYAQHKFGADARDAVYAAQQAIARDIGAESPEDIVFTASSTEANNLAILGLRDYLKSEGRTHIVTTAVEHKSALGPVEVLVEEHGFTKTVVPADRGGYVHADEILDAVKTETGLVSVQAINNVTGALQPIKAVSAALHSHNVILHTDAAQAVARMRFSVAPVDLAVISAHKSYGPQGIAALYVSPEIRPHLRKIITGGNPREGLRPGTTPVMLCVGFGKVCELSEDEDRDEETARLEDMRLDFLTTLKESVSDMEVFEPGPPELRVPGIFSLRFPGVDIRDLAKALPEICFGSMAWTPEDGETIPNHVITAITGDETAGAETIRISFGRFTTPADMKRASHKLAEAVIRLQDPRKARTA